MLPSIGTLRRLASSLGVSEASLLGDQREIVEEFFSALSARGVAIPTTEQARKLAEAVAGIYEAFGLAPAAVEAAPVEPVPTAVNAPLLAGPG